MDDGSLDPNSIHKYITPLNIPTTLVPISKCGKDYYNISYQQVPFNFHPDIPTTQIWSFNGIGNLPLIEAKQNKTVKVKWINALPTTHLLKQYLDHSIMGAEAIVPDVRNVTHLHGGEQTTFSDGGPTEWFTPGQFVRYIYPNQQQPTMLVFHDHCIGITRLNAYAGLTGGIYIIRDKKEGKLCLPKNRYEIPLVLLDRMFFTDGSLMYTNMPSGPEHCLWSSHFLGNVMTVNNSVWPYLEVDKHLYRFRLGNLSDTRFYRLRVPGLTMVQIGTDGGYLPEPILIESLVLAPGERADIIVDFREAQGEYIMTNTPDPTFPGGTALNSTITEIMKFIVNENCYNDCDCCCDIRVLDNFVPLDPLLSVGTRWLTLTVDGEMNNVNALYINNSHFDMPVTERPIVYTTEIWEYINITNGPHPMHIHLIQFQLLNRQKIDAKAYWQAVIDANTGNADDQTDGCTADIMPGMGIVNQVDPTPFLIGDPVFPQGTNEYGWKDTIRANGGEVTRLICRFAPQKNGTKFPFDPTIGEYMHHCHILSHEDNDMMRPYRLFREVGGYGSAK